MKSGLRPVLAPGLMKRIDELKNRVLALETENERLRRETTNRGGADFWNISRRR